MTRASDDIRPKRSSSAAVLAASLASLPCDLAYLAFLLVAWPILLARMAWKGKLRTDWGGRFGFGEALPRRAAGGRARILIHAVSVGEVNAIRGLVERLSAATDAAAAAPPEVVVSTTTDTGFARARALFGGRHAVMRTPFDLSFAVRRWLARADADLLVLVELELWPNMTRLAEARGMPVVVVNGRLSDRSIRRYRRVRALVRGMFARATVVLAQSRVVADRFAELGARETFVTGNMKWDSIAIRDGVPGAEAFAESFGLPTDAPLVVAGSTEPGEEILLRDALPAGARLLIAPRKPEWWDGVAANLPGCVRRSKGERGGDTTRYFLLDTIGELSTAYALADAVVMGRSFGRLYGSDPIEPASLGKPVVIGPRVADFREVVEAFKARGGLLQVEAAALAPTLARLLSEEPFRRTVAAAGVETIRREQGGTARTAEVLLSMLPSR
ncbi:MAG: 3-deoxy-D-manno-octulosonic-acid transferase [Planctomycetota bacterium]